MNNIFMKIKNADSPFLFAASRITFIALVIGLLLRIILLFNPLTVASFTFIEWIKIFVLGTVNDLCFSILSLIPFFILCIGYTERKYSRSYSYIIEALLVAATVYVFFLPSIFNEYGGGAPKIAKAFFAYKLVSFSIRLFFPNIRKKWRVTTFHITMFIYLFILLFNAIGEYFFWNEFGVRYNFIAVDYLIYTNEVIGNIFESYPMIPLICVMIAFTIFIQWLLSRHNKISFISTHSIRRRTTVGLVFIVAALLCNMELTACHQYMRDNNTFANELQSNGGYDFYLAFRNNELKYDQFYPLLPENQCKAQLYKLCNASADGVQHIQDSLPEEKKNIVMITVESLSADFLKDYGNTDDITPNLDTLMRHSLVFDNLYAVGNRTVRGLEALSLCIPPSAGESVVKRPGCKGYRTIGRMLREKGYTTQFIYGGDSYFDNMGEYFGNNGYQVIDKKSLAASEITFSNIWGVCDEDSYRHALRVFDADYKQGKPFFADIMTISNHRPFTYPEGKIQLKGNPKSRDGGVKYTDYAIGKFLSEAKNKPWFRNTIFIIVADHCASSAGSTSLPLDKYHIPAIVYAPGFIQPQRISQTCSQIDLMPTVLSLLHFSYNSRFVGQNILSPTYQPRAFMATYQDLGYYEGDRLTVLSPVRRITQYTVKNLPDDTFEENLVTNPIKSYVSKAEIYYQSANMYLGKNKK